MGHSKGGSRDNNRNDLDVSLGSSFVFQRRLGWVSLDDNTCLFPQVISKGSEYQIYVRQALSGEPLERVMNPNPIIISPEVKLSEMVSNYFYRYPSRAFAVAENGAFYRPITVDMVRDIPEEKRDQLRAKDVESKEANDLTIMDDKDLFEALKKMNSAKADKLIVLHQEGGT